MFNNKKISNISISSSEKLSLISNLATMLGAGLSILEIVDSLLEDAKGNMKKMLEVLRADLMAGNHVATAFEKFPKVFDKITVNLIRASEEGGTLDITLKDLKDNIKKEQEFHDRIKSALIYPIFIVFVFIGVLGMILVVVVPKISTVFSRLNTPLPLPTKVLIALSDLVVKQTIPFILGLIAIVAITVFLYRTQRQVFVNALAMLPGVSTLVREIDLTRFTRSLYLLLSSGITITNALDLTQEVVVRRDVARAIAHTKEVVLSGKKLSEGLKDAKGIFPSIMIKITEAGEKSGSLDRSMQDASEYLDYQVSSSLKTLTALLEPIMLVVVGVLVGGMMLSIIAPIYGLIGQVGGK